MNFLKSLRYPFFVISMLAFGHANANGYYDYPQGLPNNDSYAYYGEHEYSQNDDGYASYGQQDCCPVNSCGSNWFWSNCCLSNLYVDGEYLYWRATEDGLPVAISEGSPLSLTEATTARSKIHDMHFDWDSGFRIGIGANLSCCECVDFSAYWTHFCGHGSRNIRASVEDPILNPAWGANFSQSGVLLISSSGVDKVSSNWHMNLDLVDLTAARHICILSCLSIKPYIGVRIARIEQKFRIHSESAGVTSGGIPSTAGANGMLQRELLDLYQQTAQVARANSTERVLLKSVFEGAGLRFGLGLDWNLGCGFSIYGDGAYSIVYGRFRIHAKEVAMLGSGGGIASLSQKLGSVDPINFEFATKDKFCKCQGILDGAIGLRWRHCFCNIPFTLQAGWEQHLFFNQNRFDDLTFADVNSGQQIGGTVASQGSNGFQLTRGDLCVHGLVLSAAVEF